MSCRRIGGLSLGSRVLQAGVQTRLFAKHAQANAEEQTSVLSGSNRSPGDSPVLAASIH